MPSYASIPRFVLTGGPGERGTQYGMAARGLISRSVDIYRDWFSTFAGVSWDQALAGAAQIETHLKEHTPELLAEMQGIADGAEQSLATIVALNARTEIAYGLGLARSLSDGPAARGGGDGDRDRERGRDGDRDREGCTSFAVLPEHTGGLGPVIGQNWDWLRACMEVRVALQIKLPGGPDLLTFCEAGQVGKIGLNSAGLVVCLNLLATVADGDQGIPVHVLCRMALEQQQLSGVLRAVAAGPRAASGNLLAGRGLPDGQGEALDVEFSPLTWGVIPPVDGCLVHANHFLTPAGAADQAVVRPGGKSTYLRQIRCDRLLRARLAGQAAGQSGGQVGDGIVAELGAVLADHFDYPYSICGHPTWLPGEHGGTNLGFIALPSRGEFWLTDGPPCGEGRVGSVWHRFEVPWAGKQA